MKFSKIIEVDIWSSFGCFSKPFSTTGGILSYLIPPKTTIIGMIGAVLGYRFDDFEFDGNVKKYKIESLNNIKFSVCPLFDLKTKRVSFNQINGMVKKGFSKDLKIFNIHQDLLINPKYKLFIAFPDSLSKEESLFLNSIKKNESIFNLYMGKNEFLLNLEFIKEWEGEFYNFNSKNSDELEFIKIYGSLNRKSIKSVEINYEDSNDSDIDSVPSPVLDPIILINNPNGTRILKSYYEYVIDDYPIKRESFTDFSFSKISFYSTDNFENIYFSNVILKEESLLELVKIGENKWLSLI